MKYNYLRVFAVEVEVPPLLIAAGDAPQPRTRSEYLRDIFGQRIEFEHWGNLFTYIPISKDEVENGFICAGRIGSLKTRSVNASPEELFEPETATDWVAANFLIDTRDHSDGQKIAMQQRAEVGRSLSVLNSLAKHINETNPDSGWELSINSITEKTTFWQAAKEHKGEITKAEFHYVTPNVLGLRSKINGRLKDYKEQENANQVTVTLENQKGDLHLDSQEVRDAVEYTSEGGGSTKLKVGSKVVYDSRDDEKSVSVETDDQISLEEEGTRKGIIGKIFGI